LALRLYGTNAYERQFLGIFKHEVSWAVLTKRVQKSSEF
jgi:hypothetical protein